jgi:hypothetical protein
MKMSLLVVYHGKAHGLNQLNLNLPVAGAAAFTSWKIASTLSTCCGNTSFSLSHSKNKLNGQKDAFIKTLFREENSRSLALKLKKFCLIQ